MYFTSGGRSISWSSIKESCLIGSTMEANNVAALEATKEVVFLINLMTDLEVVPLLKWAIL